MTRTTPAESVWRAGDELREFTFDHATETAHIWFRIDHDKCTIEHVAANDNLTGWTGVLVSWVSLHTIGDVVEERVCECEHGERGKRKCLAVTAILKLHFGLGFEWGGASVGGELGSREIRREVIEACTDCCCDHEETEASP